MERWNEGGGLKKTEDVRRRSDGNKQIVLYSSRNVEGRQVISDSDVRRGAAFPKLQAKVVTATYTTTGESSVAGGVS